jgi:hypothetical protein
MSYTKTIVCLANSRKLAGRCVAGKEWDGQKLGPWCRPVSDRGRGEITAERWYVRTWRDPQLLDLIEVTLVAPRPSTFQVENHLVDPHVRRKFAGHVTPRQLEFALDHPNGDLWMNGDSTTGGLNDRVPAPVAERQRSSLVLVQPEELTVSVGTEGAERSEPRRRVRGNFSLAGQQYKLAITDPVVEKQMLANPDGFALDLRKPILCISLTEKFAAQNACYKIIAGVVRAA